MTTLNTPTPASFIGGFHAEAFASFLSQRDEPAWLTLKRREALAKFELSNWPTLRDEEWRRTDIRALKLSGFAPPPTHHPDPSALSAVETTRAGLASHCLTGVVQIDGVLAQKSDSSGLPTGVVFQDLGTAVQEHPELIRRHFQTEAVTPDTDVFSALHGAFFTGGAVLYVPRGVKVETPLYHLISMTAQGSVDLSHTLVVLEEGAEVTLVQQMTSYGRQTPGLHVGAVELIQAAGSRLRFVNLQNWDNQTWHFSRERALVGRDSRLQWTVGGLGSRLAKVNQEVALTAPGAGAQVNGVMFTTGRQNLTYITRQDHQAPNTTSDLLYKGALKDNSRIVWKGMIRVEKEAQKTDAYQKNDTLVLDHTARVDSIPGLEIEANDVRCTHGATAGQVDDEMVFYLQARGISRETAVRLIIEGFFANVYDRITLEPVQETLREAVESKLSV